MTNIVVLIIAVAVCFICMIAGRSDTSDAFEDDEETWLLEEEEDDED